MRLSANRPAALIGAVVLPIALLTGLPAASAAPVVGVNVLYTTDADFDSGTLTDVNHDSPNNNQLQLDRTQTFFPYVNIAASARGTMIRIDVDSGAIVGEWFSAPSGRGRNPSRTTVDRLGNTWFTNRDESSGGRGSVTRVGVVVGGTRVNSDASPNPLGNYLLGPFAYNTCADRDSDGLIATSRGLGDIRPWTNAGGADDNGGVSTAADECLINYTRVAGTNTRTVAVDANNDIWTGGSNTAHEKVNGATGAVVPGSLVNFGCGGYGGLIDKAGTLWSARYGANLLRYVPGGAGACLNTSHGDYGLGMDPVTGEIWHTSLGGGVVMKLDAAGNVLGTFPHGGSSAQGVAVDADGNVWVAHSLFNATTIGHLRTDGTFVGNVTLPGGNGPTGVAVDSNGKVWVANINSNNAQRIDPDAGPIGGGGFPVGAVDLTVDLGAGAGPYNYSDMTGAVLGEITAPIGTWSVVQDGGVAGRPWGKVTWNTEAQGSVPPGTSITVEARAADTEAGLPAATFVPVGNANPFLLTGRYIEVRATLRASPSGASPILSDLRIETLVRDGGFSCQATALNLAGIVVARANPPDVPCADDDELVASIGLGAGILGVQARALEAHTTVTPDDLVLNPPAAGDGATASARVEWTRITATLVTIEIGVISSSASVTCVASAGGGLEPKFTSTSLVAGLRVNGVPITVGANPVTVPLVIGTLRLNSTTTTPTSMTRHAVILDTLLTDLVLGESKVNLEDNPCSV